ncbi:MAG: formate dehydrogenase subunit alpha, partial [Chloroflexi bacterium]|nr:formate dehydrogenase subunit alpha [Chloroflexota bacterium]
NGHEVEVPNGSSVLDAINRSGTYISQLCKDPDMKPIGACRTCLVQIEGQRGFPASCSVPARDGLKVWTDTPEVQSIRRGVLELTLAMFPQNGANGSKASPEQGRRDYRELSIAARHHGIAESRWQGREREATDMSNPVFNIAMDSCILCGRCAQACQDGHQFIGAIDFLGAGRGSRIGTFADRPLVESVCTTCGSCLSVCPTGAIDVKAPVNQARVVKSVTTTCPYCGVGCGIKAQVDESDRILEMLDDPENQSSVGMLCVKGRFGYTFVHHPDRLTTPLIRRNGQLVPATWDEALDYVAERLSQYRGDAFGTLCSAKATNEDGYIQQKFARLVMQSNHIDHCTRLCHSPSVEAMLAALGSGATSNSYVDYEEAGCLVIIGSDANANHPVAASRMRRAVIERGAKLIVINPRRIEMCDFAELWLRPRPGTDVALLNAMAKVILDEGLADEEFISRRTEGFEEWREVVDKYTLEYAEQITGVPADDIAKAARIYAKPPFSGSCLIWGMGITQHTMGTANAHGLLNLAFVAGQLGRPGSGISPLRGQNNVQGCGDAGCLPNAFPGYQTLSDASVAKFQQAWGSHPLNPEKGLVITDMVQAINDGRMKAMYITGENPLLSEPDLHHAEESFRKLEFLVVQDIFMHETAAIADVVLPATSFAEKDGTFTNSERRVQRVRKAVEPVGQSRADWAIICDLAQRMSRRLGLGMEAQFSFSHPSQIWDEMARLTPIVAGISYDRLESGGIQWPCPTPDHPGTRFLYENDFPRGPRAKFVGFEQGPQAEELPSRRFPLILNTGRILYHWHGGTITRRASNLLARAPELQIAMSAEDGAKYDVADGEWIRLVSRRGELEGRAMYTEKMRAGEVFVPFTKLQDHAANFLTNAVFDPNSRIPEYKVCAVRIEKIDAEGNGHRGRRKEVTARA